MVEIDISHDSPTKMAIYAAMIVQEVWRYDGRRGQMQIYHLKDDSYVEVSTSLAFPKLTAAKLSEVLELSKTKGQTTTMRAFRQWVRKTK
jgi:Uma2 family endonuclease